MLGLIELIGRLPGLGKFRGDGGRSNWLSMSGKEKSSIWESRLRGLVESPGH